jgi:predicted ABC-type ATPase
MRLQEFLISEGIEDKGIFKAVFMAGHPGAGKTFVLNNIKAGSISPRWVNTDKSHIAKDKLKKLDKDSMFRWFHEHWNEGWPLIKDDVKRVNKTQLTLYINSMLPLAVDGTSNSIDMMHRRRGILESFGYDCGMVFVNTDLETAIERASVRASKEGRDVKPDFIKSVYADMQKNKSYYRSKFNDWIEINNADGELTQKTILSGFKRMNNFYNSPVVNPTGKRIMEKMRENGWKYLHPNVRELSEIKRAVSVWYKSM